MKKFYLLLVLLLLVTGCGSKKDINSEELRKSLESDGFIVVENKEKLTDFPGDSALVASNNSGYAFMILTFSTSDTAKSSFNKLRDQTIEDNAKTKSAKKSNWEEFIQESKNNYYHMIRVDKNILVAYGNIDKKDDIKKELKKLGY